MSPIQQTSMGDLVCLIELILRKNNLTFDEKHYLELHGTAMGHLQGRLLNQVDDRPDIWWRYIDDVFMVWLFGKGCLTNFLD